MNKYACNPYLPLDEFVPDAEPRVFGDRVYIYGSHDRSGGSFFCTEDYVVWSAPVNDLANWRFDGVSYRKNQDPHNPDGRLELFAPDLVKGTDGRYYLYYCLRMQQEFGVAVGDSPAGPFEFYAHIRKQNGELFSELMPYDPSVLVDDDGEVYLYYGFSSDMLAEKFNVQPSPGCLMIKLAADMCTAISDPVLCIPRDNAAKGTSFEGHAYFEAPSMRKIDNRYYLVYSSQWCHELCYAISEHPDRGFVYGGVIVSNADIGMNGNELPRSMPGNNHGGLVRICDKDYIFYHRHTHCHMYSRQGCAEPVSIKSDGSISQVEQTSSGLNGAALPAAGEWSAARACNLESGSPEKMLDFRNIDPKDFPAIREESDEHFIHNITNGVKIGFKYFRFEEAATLRLTLRGKAEGALTIYSDTPDDVIPGIELKLDCDKWQAISIPIHWNRDRALFIEYSGIGSWDMLSLSFSQL